MEFLLDKIPTIFGYFTEPIGYLALLLGGIGLVTWALLKAEPARVSPLGATGRPGPVGTTGPTGTVGPAGPPGGGKASLHANAVEVLNALIQEVDDLCDKMRMRWDTSH